MQLVNKTKNGNVVAQEVVEAKSFWQRLVGLMAHKSLPAGQTMWLAPCNNIHTCFMNFPIDVVFVDKNLQVKGVAENVKPFRLHWKTDAYSVFEMNAGQARLANIEVGDQLHVVN